MNGCFGQSNNDFQRGTSWRKPWRQSRQEIPAQYWQKSILMKILAGNPSRSLDENSGGDLGENLGGKFLRKSRRTLPRILAGKPSRNLDENPGGHQLSENLGRKSLQESWRKSWREIPAGILTKIPLTGTLARILAGNHCENLKGNPGGGFSENLSEKFKPESWRKSWWVSCWKSRPHRYFQMLLTAIFLCRLPQATFFLVRIYQHWDFSTFMAIVRSHLD